MLWQRRRSVFSRLYLKSPWDIQWLDPKQLSCDAGLNSEGRQGCHILMFSALSTRDP